MAKAFDQYSVAMPVSIIVYEQNVKVHLYEVQIVLFLNFAPTTIYHAIEIAWANSRTLVEDKRRQIWHFYSIHSWWIELLILYYYDDHWDRVSDSNAWLEQTIESIATCV